MQHEALSFHVLTICSSVLYHELDSKSVCEGMADSVQGQVTTSAYGLQRFSSLSLSFSCILLLPSVLLKADINGVLSGTNFKSSESSWLSLVGVLIPLFLARGHPERLKTESMELIT